MIPFLKVWRNTQPNRSFVLQSPTPDVATEVSCSVTAEQENSDEGDAAHVVVVEDMNKVPHCTYYSMFEVKGQDRS